MAFSFKCKASLELNRRNIVRLLILLLLVGGITAVHYSTGTEHSHTHNIYRRLYYLPIVLGGIWFCLRGGVGVAVLVSILYAPHVLLQWGNQPSIHEEQYLEILLYNTIGFLTGFLSSREYQQRVKAENAANRLADSYAKLKEQTDQIFEIEDQLRRADRLTALGELSAGMAHEIRNPLGSIRGTAEILQDAFSPEDSYAEFSRILVSEVDRLNKVLEDFLSFARPEESEQGDFLPTQVLHEVLQLVRLQAEKKQIYIDWDEKELPLAAGDGSQFKQVFLNLILNAIQVLPIGGHLSIEHRIAADNIDLIFSDNGPGIPEEDLDKIFNPFFTTKKEGTGLGLAITYRIVQHHCGRISVENQPDGGARFTLSLRYANTPCVLEEENDA